MLNSCVEVKGVDREPQHSVSLTADSITSASKDQISAQLFQPLLKGISHHLSTSEGSQDKLLSSALSTPLPGLTTESSSPSPIQTGPSLKKCRLSSPVSPQNSAWDLSCSSQLQDNSSNSDSYGKSRGQPVLGNSAKKSPGGRNLGVDVFNNTTAGVVKSNNFSETPSSSGLGKSLPLKRKADDLRTVVVAPLTGRQIGLNSFDSKNQVVQSISKNILPKYFF